MENLLNKYAGGRIPPLVPPAGEPDENGLLDGDLVAIYQRGFSVAYSIPLGILAAEKVWNPVEAKWQNANYIYNLNEFTKQGWISFCQEIRKISEGDKACEHCDRFLAMKAEQEGGIIAHICCHGMIDFAVPVFLDGVVIAVLFTGQRKPKPGSFWSPKIIKEGGFYRPLLKKEEGIDIWPNCAEMISQAETRFGLPKGKLFSLLDEDVRKYPGVEVSPTDVERIRTQLTKASEHLSQLSTTTLHLEKAKLVAWIRSKIAGTLKSLTVEPPSFEEFWQSVSSVLTLVSRYFGCDYAAILSCQEDPEPSLKVLTQSGKGDYEGTGVQEIRISGDKIHRLIEIANLTDEVQDIDASLYASVLEAPLKESFAYRDIVRSVSIPAGSSKTRASLIVMGRTEKDFYSDLLPEIDRQALREVIGDISLVIAVALLVEELKFAVERQASFVLNVSHDIRNPIQNIVVKAERLKSGLVKVEDIPYQAKRIAALVKRLHLLSERVWTLEAFERGTFEVEKGARLNVYDVIRECYYSFLDLASGRKITISIKPELQQWPALNLDRRFFTQTILNLLDNAVKYSRIGTEVRVDGKEDMYGWHISVGNRGRPIKHEEYGKIFDRFFRTIDARLHVREGTGIGLFLVKKFADIYGEVSVNSQPIPGSRDYLTVFTLSIKKE